MTHSSAGRSTDAPAAVRHRRAARRVSMIIGLTLAVAAAAAMYVTLFRRPASAAPQVSSYKAITFRRLDDFVLASAPASVQLDPDGAVVVVVTANGKVKAWSTSNRRQHNSFATVHDGIAPGSQYFNSPMFSPGGMEFSAVDNDSSAAVADIWNVATGRATTVPLPAISSTSSYSPSYTAPGPDGLIAASYAGGTLGLVAQATGLPYATFSVNRAGGIAYQIGEPIFSPNGKTVAVSDDLGQIHLVNVPGKHLAAALTPEKIYNIEWDLNGMSSMDIDTVTFSPDSKRVACGTENGIVRVWDVPSGRSVSVFNINGGASGSAAAGPVQTLVFSPDGKTLVTADNSDNTLGVWDVASGRRIAALKAGTGNVASAAFMANGTLVVATTSNSASDHRIEIWTTGQSLTATS